MINVAVVGMGYWGPNLVRNLLILRDVRVSTLCDSDIKRAETVRQRFCPSARVTNNYKEIAEDPNIMAVVIATPIRSHFELGKAFLMAGKNVLLEKPLAQTKEECQALIDLAKTHRLVLMVGHIFEFNIVVQKIKQYLDDGLLGKLFYVYSQRVNLGRIQNDVNALWSFAPHDVSILNYWLASSPLRVTARGFSFLTQNIEDVVFITLEYPNGISAHLHLGWLDPRKVRLMTLVGSKKMLVYDDVTQDDKIKIYDKGIVQLDEFIHSPSSFAEFQFKIRSGDVTIPTIQFGEPLQTECQHFIDCIQKKCDPLADGENGLRVVKVLEAAEQSLKQSGRPVDL
jgi:predicted dehydrogenase